MVIRSNQGLALATVVAALLAASPYVAVAGVDESVIDSKMDGNPVDLVSATYFRQYSVNTAADMLKYLPGVSFSLTGATNERGLGESSGNVLVNGRKVGGKQNDALDYAERIPAANVSHIEIFREPGTIYGLRSTGLLVNIVLKEADTSLSGVWKVSARRFRNGTVLPDAQATASLLHGDSSYTLSVEGIPKEETQVITENRTRPLSGTHRDFYTDDSRESQSLKISGNADFQFSGNTSVRLNGYFEDNRLDRLEASDIDFYDGLKTISGGSRNQYETDNWKSNEASITLVSPLSDPVELEVIAVHSRYGQNKAETIYQDEVDSAYRVDGKQVRIQSHESILRPTVRWSLSHGNQLRFGVEGAYNSYITGLNYAVSDDMGVLVPREIDNGEADIAEKRYEAFLYLSWLPFDGLTVDAGSVYEMSQISQVGATLDQARTLRFLKPSFQLSYRHSEALVLKASLKKSVGQLNFDQFVSSIDSQQNKVDSGNPDLVPQSAWNVNLGVDFKLPSEGGHLGLSGFYKDIADAVENIPFGENESVVGNVESAQIYGLRAESGLNLENLGLMQGGQFDLRLTLQDSEIRDPFLHTLRPMSSATTWAINTTWRQSIPALQLIGAISWARKSAYREYDIDETSHYYSEKGDLSASLTHTLPSDLALTLTFNNILDEKQWRDRERYLVSVMDGTVKETEVRSLSHGHTVRLSVQGSF